MKIDNGIRELGMMKRARKRLNGKEPEQKSVRTAAVFLLEVASAAVSLMSLLWLLLPKPDKYCF